ncbi:hypothetical protein P3T76_009358 [Phytophthora citrophthora]|uniref:Uncharacterized protein n=1 Tax=Phytophthora citrophthora TaxID=4793 RepID=A0AAD9GHC6_9STRA|nr:hypothetical protein P3T76_009358 [Phytophthora citrophthora]
MAKGIWMSEEERERIVQMRKNSESVKNIAKKTQRSTNCIYRILRKAGVEPPAKKKQKTAIVSDLPVSSTANERQDQLLEELSDSSNVLLCAVENMEVSTYEPIPMPRSVSNTEQRQPPERPEVDTRVAFSGEASDSSNVAKPHNSDEIWLEEDNTPSISRSATPAPSKKAKTPTPSAPIQPNPQQDALLVSLQPTRLQNGTTAANAAVVEGLGGLLKQVQDEIRRLEGAPQSDIYDAQLLQMLVKFHAEMLLVQIQKTLFAGGSRKRIREENAEEKETSRLLREKLNKEIALLNVQADREKLELEREQIRHNAASMICRKTLLEANASLMEVAQLFPRQ